MTEDDRKQISLEMAKVLEQAGRGKPFVCIMVDFDNSDTVPYILSSNLEMWQAMGTLLHVASSIHQNLSIQAMTEQASGPAN